MEIWQISCSEDVRQAQMEIEKPSIIIGHTIMAQGCATMEDDHNTHGAPLPPEEIAATKEKLDLNPEEFFQSPHSVGEDFRKGIDFARSEVAAKHLDISGNIIQIRDTSAFGTAAAIAAAKSATLNKHASEISEA